jgi:hypothetical protein
MKVLAFVFAVASGLVPAAGGAATLSVLGTNSSAWVMADPKPQTTTLLGPYASWITSPVVLSDPAETDPCVSACSPFDPKVYGTDDDVEAGVQPLSNWSSLPFFAVWANDEKANSLNEAILRFSRPQTALRLLWGSLDRTNLIEFFLGDTVKTVSGHDLPDNLFVTDEPGQGAALIRISGLKFDRVRFTSQSGAFEMTNITSEVPLPPALLMLAGAFGLLGVAARRRRA